MILISIMLAQFSFAQIAQIKFEQLDSLQKIEKRPVVVFLYTSWCKYCGIMKNITLKNDEVVRVLNQKYYFVSLDVEEKKDILFRQHTFSYKPTGANTGVNELAEQLGTINSQFAYPAICFLNVDYEIIYQQQGYVSARQLVAIMRLVEKQ